MSNWQIGRVRVKTVKGEIRVTGVGVFADRLRELKDGSVWIVPPPAGSVDLRGDSDWLVDRWVRQWAAAMSAGDVTSDYEPSDDDIPDDARELIAARANSDDTYVEGRIY